jgi:hypothetical protein
MRRQDLPLLLAGAVAPPGGDLYPLDRIRMQKAVFLLVERGGPNLRNLYSYRPYNWGPYSDELAADLRSLQAAGRLSVDTTSRRYGRYTLTPAGAAVAAQVSAELTPFERAFVADVRNYVTKSSFSKLLREVYAAYPDYATASQFNQ